MKKDEKNNQEYHSFQEFKEKFYPDLSKRQSMETDDPFEFGAKLAKKSLMKLKHMLQK